MARDEVERNGEVWYGMGRAWDGRGRCGMGKEGS